MFQNLFKRKNAGETQQATQAQPPSQIPANEDIPEEFVVTLDEEKRLSESFLWKMHEDYYHNLGVSAWDAVPFYVTSNAFIGDTYAELALGFLLDYLPHLNKNEPLYLVEMATGTGTFSFYFLTALLQKIKYFHELDGLKIRYLMTDFTDSNVQFWESNPTLLKLHKEGVLDFAVFRPEDDERMVLRGSGEVVEPGKVKNPIIAVANYFFDTIRQDLFRVDNHKLQEIRLGLQADKRIMEPDKHPPFDKIKTTSSFVDISEKYYDDPHMNEILKFYKDAYEKGSIVFPVGAFKVIQNLMRISENKLVLLSSDKGYTEMNYMQGHWVPGYAVHGSFSYMVNYHAIQRYFNNLGGMSFSSGEAHHSLKTIMCVKVDKPIHLDHVNYACNEILDKLNPINNIYNCRDLIYAAEQTDPSTLLRSYIAFLRTSHFDPVMLYYCGDKIRRVLKDMKERDYYLEASLAEVVQKARERFYPARQGYNSLYWMGSLYYNMDRFDECLDVLQQSLDVFGDDDRVVYLMACCYEVKQQFDKALETYQKALALDPGCQFTQEAIDRVIQKRRQNSSQPA